MARLFTSGFEIDTTTSGVEWTDVAGGASIATSIVRSGARSAQLFLLSSGTRKGWAVQFAASLSNGPFYSRFAFHLNTAPSGQNTVFAWIAGATVAAATSNDAQIRLNADGSLALYADDAQVGSNSAALDLGRWYEITTVVDNGPASGSKILRAYIDGEEFAGTAAASNVGGTVNGISVGGNLRDETNTAGAWLFDDVAVNDSSGATQNSIPPSGSVIVMFPDGAGDSNDWNNTANAAGGTTNSTLVDENPPDDASTMVQTGTLNALDLYAMESSGIGVPDTVNVVHVHARRRNNVADATTAFAVLVEKTTGGTQAQGASTVPNTTTWRTGGAASGSSVRDPNITLYADPDGAAWTQSTLGTMQAGVKLVTAGTNRVQVSALWATVDYTRAPARRLYLSNEAADYTPATKRGAWDNASATLARKLGYTSGGAAATAAVAETSATGDFDVLLGRWISEPATVAGTLDGYLHWVIGAQESLAAADLVFHWHLYVTQGDSDTVRGTLRTDYVGSTEWSTSASGRNGTNITMSPVDVEVGDRLCLEMGYRAQNTVTTSYTGTIHYGNAGLSDLTAGSTAVTTLPGWVELTGAVDIFDPDGGSGDATATPATVAAVASIPSPTVSSGSTVSAAVVAAAAAIPSPTVSTSTDATATPATVAAVATVPSPTVAAGSTASPATVAAAATISAPTVSGSATFAAATVQASAAVPAPTVTASAAVAPAVVPATTTIPAPSVSAGAQATPGTVAAVAAIPAAAAAAGAGVAPATVAAVAAVPAPTLSAGATVTASAVAAQATIPAPAVTAGGSATATPVTVNATAAVPAATLSTSSTVAAATVEAAATVPAPSVAAGATTTPATVTATAAVPTPAAGAGATTAPNLVQAAAAVPAPAVQAGGSATATPTTVAATAVVPAPALSTASTAGADTVQAVAAVPAPSESGGATAGPATVQATTAVPAPAVAASSTATPTTVVAVAGVPAPTASAGSGASPATVSVVTVIPAPTVDTATGATASPQPVAAVASVPQASFSAGVSVAVATVQAVASIPSAQVSTPGARRPGVLTASSTRPRLTASTSRASLRASTVRGV